MGEGDGLRRAVLGAIARPWTAAMRRTLAVLPPPPGVTRQAFIDRDPGAFELWVDSLGLGNAKRWCAISLPHGQIGTSQLGNAGFLFLCPTLYPMALFGRHVPALADDQCYSDCG